MQGFVEWLDTHPFYVKGAWDFEKNKNIGVGRMQLAPHLRRIFQHCFTPDADGVFPYTTVILSAPKKSGKTTWSASIGAWYADVAEEGTEIYVLANSLDQVSLRVLSDIKYHYKKVNMDADIDAAQIKMKQYEIKYPNDTFIMALASSYRTVAGSRHALTLTDELWGFTTEEAIRVWDEMTPIPTIPNSLRVVTTYAGYFGESKLLWDLYEQGVGDDEWEKGKGEKIPGLEDLPCWRNGRQFTYWDHMGRMPWQTDTYYEEQMKSLRASTYLRLHENQWVTSNETFIPVEWWDNATKKYEHGADLWTDHPYRLYPVFVGVDGATKRDCTACVGVTLDTALGKIVVLFSRIWRPRPGDQLDLDATLESYLITQKLRYNIRKVSYDPTQLQQTMLRLKGKGVNVAEFVQHPNNMVKASQALFDVFKEGNVWAYPDEDLRTHLLNAVAKEESRGFRIVKELRNRSVYKPQDGAIALAIAVSTAIDGLGTSNPHIIKIASPFSDVTAWKAEKQNEANLPWMFRN